MGRLPAPPPTTIQYDALPSEPTNSDSSSKPVYRGPQTAEEEMLRDEVYGKNPEQRYYDAVYGRAKKLRPRIQTCMNETMGGIVFAIFVLAFWGLAGIAFYIASVARPDIAWLKPSADTAFMILAATAIVLAIWYSVKRSQCGKEASRQAGPKPRKPHQA
jgi:hypothetical protein